MILAELKGREANGQLSSSSSKRDEWGKSNDRARRCITTTSITICQLISEYF